MKWYLTEFWQWRCCSQAGHLLSSLTETADIWCDVFACLLSQQRRAELAAGQKQACSALQLQLFPFFVCFICMLFCVYLGKAVWNQKFTISSSSLSASVAQIKGQTCCERESVSQLAAISHTDAVPISLIPVASY